MRLNEPVTQREHPFPTGQTLVSTTDLQGRILYCNNAFIAVSGYTREELLGQPHNMIRHPDMPEDAFRDMWITIQAGKPWSALVKNRRKNGDHYWVVANVTPLMDGDRPLGYMSVRTCPSQTDVQAAEALYAQMRQEQSTGHLVHKLHDGVVIRNTLGGRLRRWTQLGLPQTMGLAASLTTALGFGSAWALSVVATATSSTTFLVAGTIGSLVGGALIGAWCQIMIMTPLNRVLTYANRMAAGDLTQRIEIDHRDMTVSLRKALAQLNVNLMSIVRDARAECINVSTASAEIASGNTDLSARTESQASSLEQTASAIEQITGNVRQSADTATRAASIAHDTTQAALRSQDAVDTVNATMQSISDASHRIGEIIGVIDGIAFQTNILALNAAVEAARAGEQGRGFAVVAAEVRSLAQRTSTAAREIKQLIQVSSERVDDGNRQSDTAKDAMRDALSRVQQMGTLIDEISRAVGEQFTGLSQINDAVTQLDTLTQQNSALVEEVAASAISLQHQSQAVTQAVGVFRLDALTPALPPPASAPELRRAMKHARTQATS